jgi:hypothetical protein
MIVNFFGTLVRNHAIKRYVCELPSRLAKNYNAGEHFTRGQIETTVAELKLNPAAMIYGYAMFMDEAGFEQQRLRLGSELAYQEARAAVARDVSHKPASEASFYESGAGLQGVGDGGS